MSSTTEQVWTAASTAVVIANMTEHDLLEVVEIEEQSGLSRWGWSAYYAELQSSNRSFMFVARVMLPLEQVNSYDLAGYIIARLSGDELHINNVAVRDDSRRQGIGGALLRRILEEGRQAGALTAFLEVRSGNAVAQALYERGGFRLVGRRTNYYSEPAEDALIMSVRLKL